MNAKSAKILAIIVIILVVFVLWLGINWFRFMNSPLIALNQPSVEFVLQPGTSVKELAKELHDQGILKDPVKFVWLARIKGKTKKLQAGEYRIDPGTIPLQLLDKLATGRVILYAFTVVPGWTFHELRKALEVDPHLAHSLLKLSNAEIMKHLGFKARNFEGRFFPDTYNFHKNFKDIEILRRACMLMQKKLQQEWAKRDAGVPYKDSYTALIAASIIEKETSLAEERPIISGIIVRRLQKNMYLQLDPTVIYGLGSKFDGDLSVKNLRKDTPYNTYIHKGLPPTPICMPGEASIHAALHPAAGVELYFVAKGDGSHVFSSTLKEHDAAIKKYQLKKKRDKL